MGTVSKPQGKAMYVATQLDKSWLLSEQRKLYTRSLENPDYVFRKLWGLMTDSRNLRIAVERVKRNKGHRAAGVDGITVRKALSKGVDTFVARLRAELRSGAYRPSPVRRRLIPKVRQPGKFRALGIPTVKDRVAQAAVKNIIEPIFEADFFPSSYGFRIGKSAHAALEHLRMHLRPKEIRGETDRRLPYQWAIEGDIKACFDNINHHGLMQRVRRRVSDPKANRLIVAFLKAGVLSEGQFVRADDAGTLQGGILSPVLANIALGVIEERYERYAWPRRKQPLRTDPAAISKRATEARNNDRRGGKVVCFPIRYADDFIILVGAPPGPGQDDRAREAALREKDELVILLKERLNLELSDTKTLVTPVTERLHFLGHNACVRHHPVHGRLVSTTVIPKERSQRLREVIKSLFRRTTTVTTLDDRLTKLNPILRGWGSFYRHAWGAKRVFGRLDNYVWHTINRWIKKKHKRTGLKQRLRLYGRRKLGRRSTYWQDGNTSCFRMVHLTVEPFRLEWLRQPAFTKPSMESSMHSERCTLSSARGTQKPTGASRKRR